MTEQSSGDGRGAGGDRRDWRAPLVGLLLGTTVGDAAVNILSGDYRWRFVIVVTATGLVLAVPVWLGRYPPRSKLTRWATTALLFSAIVAAGFAAFGSARTVPWAIAVAGLLTTGAVFVPAHPDIRLRLMLGVAGIAAGIATAGAGATLFTNNDRLSGAALIAMGAAGAGTSASWLAGHDRLFGAALIAFGLTTASTGVGAALMANQNRWLDATAIAAGAATAGLGTAWLGNNARLAGVTLIAMGAAAIGAGTAWLATHDGLYGAAFIVGGLASAGLGTSILSGHDRLGAAALIAAGVGSAGLGAAALAHHNRLGGAALIAVGSSVAGSAIRPLLFDSSLNRRIRRLWGALIADPTTTDDPATPITPQAEHTP